jgi:hypothetical protein
LKEELLGIFMINVVNDTSCVKQGGRRSFDIVENDQIGSCFQARVFKVKSIQVLTQCTYREPVSKRYGMLYKKVATKYVNKTLKVQGTDIWTIPESSIKAYLASTNCSAQLLINRALSVPVIEN